MVKSKKSIVAIAIAAVVVIILGLLLASAAHNKANAATVKDSVPISLTQVNGPPPGDAYTYTGNIRPADNPHWCLTFSPVISNDAPLFMAKCVKNYAGQHFFVWRIPQAGAINVAAHPDWQVAHKARYAIAVLTNSIDPKKYTTLMFFTPYEKGWLIDTKQARVITFLTVPSHLKAGNPIYARWKAGSGSTRKSQEWLLGPWKHLAPIPIKRSNFTLAS